MTACRLSPAATSGWSSVSVSVNFDDGDPPSTVDGQVNAALVRRGWNHDDLVITAGQGKNAHWTLAISDGKRASAFAYALPAGSDRWLLSATWRPPGPVGEACP